jgi:hypothetical protein
MRQKKIKKRKNRRKKTCKVALIESNFATLCGNAQGLRWQLLKKINFFSGPACTGQGLRWLVQA